MFAWPRGTHYTHAHAQLFKPEVIYRSLVFNSEDTTIAPFISDNSYRVLTTQHCHIGWYFC